MTALLRNENASTSLVFFQLHVIGLLFLSPLGHAIVQQLLDSVIIWGLLVEWRSYRALQFKGLGKVHISQESHVVSLNRYVWLSGLARGTVEPLENFLSFIF